MTVLLNSDQMKELFSEVVAKKVHEKTDEVTFPSVQRYVKKHYDTLLKEIADYTFKMYVSSQDFKDDAEYLEERRREWAKEWEEEQE